MSRKLPFFHPLFTMSVIKFIIKFAVTGILLFLIFQSINSRDAFTALATLSPWYLVAALMLQTTSTVVAASRWCLIMSKIGFSHSWFFYLKSYFKGAFFNQGLPTSIGGDGVRILDCSRKDGSAEDSFFGVFIDRIIGLAGMLLLNIRRVRVGTVNITTLASILAKGVFKEQTELHPKQDWVKGLAGACLTNEPYEPVFDAYDEKIRLCGLEIVDKKLTLRFKPELEMNKPQ